VLDVNLFDELRIGLFRSVELAMGLLEVDLCDERLM
jgi:hypothetical protein